MLSMTSYPESRWNGRPAKVHRYKVSVPQVITTEREHRYQSRYFQQGNDGGLWSSAPTTVARTAYPFHRTAVKLRPTDAKLLLDCRRGRAVARTTMAHRRRTRREGPLKNSRIIGQIHSKTDDGEPRAPSAVQH